MRRGLIHVLAWTLATGAAVTLSWWGVHTVMAGTAYDPPRALPIASGGSTTQESKPLASSTARAEPTGSPSSTPPSAPKPSATPSTAPTQAPSPSPTASGRVKSYDTDGGRAVFDLSETYATLVSASPAAGWSMQVWKTETWIRLEFAKGADRVSVFCTWHDSAPRVEIENY